MVEHSQRQLGQKGTKKAFLGEAGAKSEHAQNQGRLRPAHSQYEEVTNRPHRSLSADHSFDSDDTADDLYSSIKEPTARVAVRPQGPGEYSLVGAASLPRTEKKDGEAGMYELVGSRPPSKSAPPTYEMVHSPKKSPPEDGEGFYDLVQGTERQQRMSPTNVSLTQGEATAPQMHGDDGEKQDKASDVIPLYSTVPKINRKQNLSARGLSMISEGDSEEEDADSSVLTPEEKVPPLPPKADLGEAIAIYEIKQFLEEAAQEEGKNEIKREETNGIDNEDEPFPVRSGSAFQQLKAFLQKLDSTEAE